MSRAYRISMEYAHRAERGPGGYYALRLAELLSQHFLDPGPLRHALHVIRQFWKLGDIDAIALQPLCQGEEIRIADRVGVAHHPRSGQHLAFDQGKALADRLGNHSLHFRDGCRIVRPAIAAHAMGVSDM